MDGVLHFFFLSFCLIWGRIVELFCPGPISPHWGVLSKCLAYSKAASDPFVYSLLRHQYRKTCSCLANKVLKRSPLNSSSNMMVNNTERSNTNSNKTRNTQPPISKPPGQWRLSLTETILKGGTGINKCATKLVVRTRLAISYIFVIANKWHEKTKLMHESSSSVLVLACPSSFVPTVDMDVNIGHK